MKKIIALVLIAVLAMGLFACAQPGEKSKTIAVVAKGESHAFWQAVKAGAEAAAKEAGYTITFRGPASESAKDLPSQIEMVQSALSSNVAGLVLATIGEGFTDLLTQAKDKNIPVIQFGVERHDLNGVQFGVGRFQHPQLSDNCSVFLHWSHLEKEIRAPLVARWGFLPCSCCAALLSALCMAILYFHDVVVGVVYHERSASAFKTSDFPPPIRIQQKLVAYGASDLFQIRFSHPNSSRLSDRLFDPAYRRPLRRLTDFGESHGFSGWTRCPLRQGDRRD